MEQFNVYCDESNHLLHNVSNIMTLGYIMCKTSDAKTINLDIRAIKEKHGLNRNYEIKWTKVSKRLLPFYEEMISYFFVCDSLRFRCIIADKTNLDHVRFEQSHDDWYYKMYYLLLGKSLAENNAYNIYLDIKDTCSITKVQHLHDLLNRSYFSFSSAMIKKIQHIHSHEVEMMQLNDLFIGAIGYHNNRLAISEAKLNVIELLKNISGRALDGSTPLFDKKFNLFVWEAR